MSAKQWVTTTPDGKLTTTIPMEQMALEERAEAVAQISACMKYQEAMKEIYQKGGHCLICGYTKTDVRG